MPERPRPAPIEGETLDNIKGARNDQRAIAAASELPEFPELTAEEEALFVFDPEDPKWAGMTHAQVMIAISEETGLPNPFDVHSKRTTAKPKPARWRPDTDPLPVPSKPTGLAPPEVPNMTMGGVEYQLLTRDQIAERFDILMLGNETYFLVPVA